MMISGVPNMAYVFGYFRASWTLRADLVSEFVCRLLAHMEERGVATVVPTLRREDDAPHRFRSPFPHVPSRPPQGEPCAG